MDASGNKEDIIEQNLSETKVNPSLMHYSQSTRRIDDDLSDDDLGSDFDYEWDEEFFKKFEWLKEKESEKRIKEQQSEKTEQMSQHKLQILKNFCKWLETELIDMEKEPSVKNNVHENRLYLYFISLENNKMFLHTDFKKEYDVVLRECGERYDYAKQNAPRKVVYTMIVDDLYDIDKHVKMFMHMFGIDDTRGGSYTDVELPEYLRNTIEYEKTITSIDYYAL